MGGLSQRGRKGIWQAIIRVDGREVRISTRTSDRETAERILAELERRARLSQHERDGEDAIRVLGLPRDPTTEPTGEVYLVGIANDPQTVKIGFTSRSAVGRLGTLQTGCPYPLELLASFPGSKSDEFHIHAKLHQERGSGEWFRLHPEDVETIRGAFIAVDRVRRRLPRGIPTN